ncbi:SOS response-associated peptidase family protein [Sphingomonas immobilis]|uniref:SOS response-associated peptidase family protein n=1 Tax=Sphingomonas immobilis TaxID=3063997 RepID=A0ABT9A165_9SPHN|nr:SOS response-associated peptidase family protein [Sphingomonas sp. CA1-15]MDO7843564.1 SOS response-associated peptidase family protein [Sphingomonas sp. CA1-15]
MSRLRCLRTSIDAAAAYLGAEVAAPVAAPSCVVEGDQGVVMFEAGGRKRLRSMRWGFPRLTREMRVRGEDPGIIGLVADLTNPMWEQMVVDPRYRCIIPITHFANPDGDAGKKTRTWFSLNDTAVMAWAGFCRNIPDVGPCYAGMTMEANSAVMPYNDRMPVLLEQGEIERWLRGAIDDVIAFQFRRPVAAARIEVIHTDSPWRGGDPPPAATQIDLI